MADYSTFPKYLLAQGSAPMTADSYLKDIEFVERELQKSPFCIDAGDLDTLFSRDDITPSRHQRLKHAWNAFVAFAAKRLGYCKDNDPSRPTLPKAEYGGKVSWTPKPSLTEQELQTMFRVAWDIALAGPLSDQRLRKSDTLISPMSGLCALAILHSGARESELCSRKVEHVSADRRFITLLGKGRKTRIVPLMSRKPAADIPSAVELFTILTKGRPKDDYLITDDPKENIPWTGKKVYRECLKIGKIAKGVSGNTNPHRLRRGYATDLYRRGIDIVKIKDLLGHSNVETTLKYIGAERYDPEELRKAIDGP